MRTLKPEVAKEREEKILRWIIQEFANTRRPVGSEMIAKNALQGVSSATIRNIMKKLEDDGYLLQLHTSGGRVPTDKAYRFYVDYLSRAQKMAAQERARIEKEYTNRLDEIDKVMLQTSRMLAMFSRSAGFVLTDQVSGHTIQRMDFMPLGPSSVLAVLVTESGLIKNWPIRVNFAVHPVKLRAVGQYINEEIAGLNFKEAQRVLWELANRNGRDIADMAELAGAVLKDMERQEENSSELYLEGISQLIENITETDYEELRQMLRMIEEKEKLSKVLGERLQDMQGPERKVSVSIGAENELIELKNLSIVSSAYKVGDKTIGLLGIIGPKHMEYTKMMSLVNFMGELLGTTLDNWRKMNFLEHEDEDI